MPSASTWAHSNPSGKAGLPLGRWEPLCEEDDARRHARFLAALPPPQHGLPSFRLLQLLPVRGPEGHPRAGSWPRRPRLAQSPQRGSTLVFLPVAPPRDQASRAFPNPSADPQMIELTCCSTTFRRLAFSLAHPQGRNLPGRESRTFSERFWTEATGKPWSLSGNSQDGTGTSIPTFSLSLASADR